ncbi:acetyltransferase [Opitutales bacterium]|nr:acetyltransferase [Opitutales bacterium]
MSNQQKIILLGAGGHCKSCIEVISDLSQHSIFGIIDKDGSDTKNILGYDILGTDKDLDSLIKYCTNALITVGQIKSPAIRISLFERAKMIGFNFPVIVSHLSCLSKSAQIGEGTVLLHHSFINSSVRVGTNSIINTKALIEHDCEIGSHCHVSTGTILNGGVRVEDRCFIGSGAIIHEDITIGSDSIISAGQVIRKDVPCRSIVR